MGRLSPIDAGMPAGYRADRAGSAVGLEDIHVRLPRTAHGRSRCSRPMAGRGSFAERMAHAAGHEPCGLEATAPRSVCEKRGITVSEEVAFAPAADGNVTEALEERIAGLLRQRSVVKEAAALRGAPCDTVRLVIDGAHMSKPEPPRVLLMDEICAFSCRDRETGKKAAAY